MLYTCYIYMSCYICFSFLWPKGRGFSSVNFRASCFVDVSTHFSNQSEQISSASAEQIFVRRLPSMSAHLFPDSASRYCLHQQRRFFLLRLPSMSAHLCPDSAGRFCLQQLCSFFVLRLLSMSALLFRVLAAQSLHSGAAQSPHLGATRQSEQVLFASARRFSVLRLSLMSAHWFSDRASRYCLQQQHRRLVCVGCDFTFSKTVKQ